LEGREYFLSVEKKEIIKQDTSNVAICMINGVATNFKLA
jgi:hypothetical protein